MTGQTMQLLPGAHWYSVSRTDPRLYALYRRHYSAEKNARWRRPGNTNSAGAGSTLCLLTVPGDAAFVWLKNTIERYDGQEGVCCTLFRNEGPYRASELIREAEALAWALWPGERLFTYVDAKRVAGEVPGYCFRRAGWRRTGQSLTGLLLFEKRSR
jgi:hypothetical protein